MKDTKELTAEDFRAPPERSPSWLIWSFEHDAWWAPDERGYTRDANLAGRYPRERAEEIVRNANRDSLMRNEALVPAPERAAPAAPSSPSDLSARETEDKQELIKALRALAERIIWRCDVSLDNIEAIAEQFRSETGFLAPGKSIPPEMDSDDYRESQRLKWGEWVNKRRAEDIVLAQRALDLTSGASAPTGAQESSFTRDTK